MPKKQTAETEPVVDQVERVKKELKALKEQRRFLVESILNKETELKEILRGVNQRFGLEGES